jgi:replicative DNA helicase
MTDLENYPVNLQAEQALLGSLLTGKATLWEDISEIITPEMFADPNHQVIYRKGLGLYSRGTGVTPVSLAPVLENDEALIDGLKEHSLTPNAYLAKLVSSMVVHRGAKEYAESIRDLWARRELMTAANELKHEASSVSPEETVRDVIGRHEQTLTRLNDSRSESTLYTPERSVDTALSRINEHRAAGSGIIGIPTGLHALDLKLRGLKGRHVTTVAARPGMGKTAWAGTIARNIASIGKPVGFLSQEMPATEITSRILSARTGIDGTRISSPSDITDEEMDRLVIAAEEMKNLPVFIDDEGALTPELMRTKARRMVRKHGIELLIVDFIQIMTVPGAKFRLDLLTTVTGAIKALAKELDIHIIALSQLSREVERRDDKRPMLSDLRESGSIEQDSDTVIFLFREEYYLKDMEPVRRSNEKDEDYFKRLNEWNDSLASAAGKAELIIAKNRHGPTGKVIVGFNDALTTFHDLGAPA